MDYEETVRKRFGFAEDSSQKNFEGPLAPISFPLAFRHKIELIGLLFNVCVNLHCRDVTRGFPQYHNKKYF